MSDSFFDKVYEAADPEETRALYDAWAASYDAEIADNGYATPGRVADAMFRFAKSHEAPLLDYGCGTGLSGLALKLAGFSTIDGMDPSQEMLDGARRKAVYRTLTPIDLSDPDPIPAGAYEAITCIGVIGTGAAPASTLDLVMHVLPKGGLLGFSLNDHALADPQYEGALNSWLDRGAANVLFREYGPHLPGQNINSTVYIIEKA
ncbi:Methyltransferase domain protein [Roseovarius sp. THAF9]|uniref:class I SAM-dependent DNA methyltransferase n=1 Tax=Roseovarius sp. THAF9 TaxID=2587847 RepID=UPI001268162F|nr:methyltransferase domain-containing protein [Roseovarius sp. THAF9]QFT92956.1 Methyltransferase domain protein [Roseovarius sp. THAF9]